MGLCCSKDSSELIQTKTQTISQGMGLKPLSPKGKVVLPGAFKDHPGRKMLKLCITGDTGVGKTCLIINYMQNAF